MRIGNLSRKAVIAVLVWCTAYVAYSEANDGRGYYSLSMRDLIDAGSEFGVIGAEELELLSDGIKGLPVSEAGEVTEGEKFLASLVGDTGPNWLIHVADKTFLPGAKEMVKEDINGVLRMKEGEGGLLGFLAGDVPSIIMPEHWKPDIKDCAIKIGNGVRGVFKALRNALCYCDDRFTESMREDCKDSIREMLMGVFGSEKERFNDISHAMFEADIGVALVMFSDSTFIDNELNRVRGIVRKLRGDLFSRDGGPLGRFIVKGVKEGNAYDQFACIAFEMLRLISIMTYGLSFSSLPIDSSEHFPINRVNLFTTSKNSAYNSGILFLALEIASARWVDAIEKKCSIEGSKSGQFEFAGEDRSPPQYPVSEEDAKRLVGGMRGGQSQPSQRVGEAPQQQLQQPQNPQQHGPDSSSPVSPSAPQLSSSDPTRCKVT